MSLNKSAPHPTHSIIKGIYCFYPYRRHHQQKDVVWTRFERLNKTQKMCTVKSRFQKLLFNNISTKRTIIRPSQIVIILSTLINCKRNKISANVIKLIGITPV